MSRELSPTVALFGLMSTQHGVASRAQARELGVTRPVEARLVREGALTPVGPGVFAAGGAPPTFAGRAMAAALRPGVVAVSHGAAARLHDLAGYAEHPRLDVIGGRGTRLRLDPPVITHYSRGPLAGHLDRVGAVPVTSVALTLTLLAADTAPAALAPAVGDALARGVAPATIRAVARAWRTSGRAGPATLLTLLDHLAAGDHRDPGLCVTASGGQRLVR